MLKKTSPTQKLRFALLLIALSTTLPIAGYASVTDNNLEPQGYYENALKRFEKGDYEGSIVQLKNVLQTSPNSLPAKILLGRAYLKANQPELAEQELQTALNNGADANLVIVELAEAQLRLNKLEALSKEDNYNLTTLSRTVKSQLYTLMGVARAKQNFMSDAERYYNKAASLDPANTSPLLALAGMAFNKRNLYETEKLLDKVDNIQADLPAVWELRARISELEGDYERALKQYDKVLEIAPKTISTITFKAEALMTMGRMDQASTLIESIYDENLFNPEVSYAYAMILSQQGKQVEAKLVLSSAHAALTSIDKEVKMANPKMLLLSTMVAFQTQDFQSAITQAYNAMERYPELPTLRMILAESLVQVDRADEALEILKPIAQQQSAPLAMLALYGHVLLLNHQYSEADRILELVAKAAPGSPVILSDLGVAQLATGKAERAKDTLTKVMDAKPGISRGGLILGFSQLDRGLAPEAENTALRMLAGGAEHPVSLNLLARAQLDQGKTEDASNSLDRALRLAPNFIPAILSYAKLEVQQNKLAAAQQRLKTAFDANPQNIRLIGALANIAELEGKSDQSISWLEKAVSVDSSELELAFRLVDKYIATGQVEKHLALTERLVEEKPESLVVSLTQAKSYIAAKKPGYARSVLSKTLHFRNLSGDKLLEVAKWQMQVNDISGAILSLNEATISYQDYIPARVELIKLETSLGNYNRALDLLKFIQSKEPNAPGTLLLEADIYTVQGDTQKSLTLLNKIMSQTPTPSAALRISQILYVSGKPDQAIATLEKWQPKFPADIQLINNLALQYLMSQRPQDAVNSYRKLVTKYPQEPTFHNNIAMAYLQLKDPAALPAAEKAFALAPQSPSILDTYGWVLTQSGSPAEGVKYLREANARDASDPSVRFHLASALSQLGQVHEAESLLARLLRENNNFAEYQQAADLLEILRSNNQTL